MRLPRSPRRFRLGVRSVQLVLQSNPSAPAARLDDVHGDAHARPVFMPVGRFDEDAHLRGRRDRYPAPLTCNPSTGSLRFQDRIPPALF
jgi:hypothetical protein